jgi:signal transduction histidine kinase
MDVNAAIGALEILVLERLPQGDFVRRGALPSWCLILPAQVLRRDAPFAIEEVFPFLTAFLEQAVAAWRGQGPGRACSDFWTEVGTGGEELHLEATAVRIQQADVLIITRNDRLFFQQQLVLQRARELRLAHNALMRELDQKDILVHAIVHDLAAPLHSILGALSLLGAPEHDDRSGRWIRIALQAATRQRQLIAEILDVFSAEQGALTQSPENGADAPDACDTIAQVFSELEPVARRRSIRLETERSDAPCKVKAEETRLFRVFTNLVDNAIRYSPENGVVRVTLHHQEAGILATVEDQGPGVPIELIPQLFEKFARGRERAAGTGLGLHFCRITVERWGGGIGYEPRLEGGARFWVRLLLAGQQTATNDRSGSLGREDGQAIGPR